MLELRYRKSVGWEGLSCPGFDCPGFESGMWFHRSLLCNPREVDLFPREPIWFPFFLLGSSDSRLPNSST